MLARLRSLSRSETGRAAELGIASMAGNVVALVFTVVFTRVLGQDDYGSLAALISTLLILNVPGYALQTTVAREVSGALAAGDPRAGAPVGRWLARLALGTAVLTVVAALARRGGAAGAGWIPGGVTVAVVLGVGPPLVREPLAALIGVGDAPWAAAAAPLAGALWLMLSIERGALVGFQRYRVVGASIVVEQVA